MVAASRFLLLSFCRLASVSNVPGGEKGARVVVEDLFFFSFSILCFLLRHLKERIPASSDPPGESLEFEQW